MLSSNNRRSQIIIAFFLIAFSTCAIFLQPAPSHPLATINAAENLQITFLLNQSPSRETCDQTLDTLINALQSACASCRLQERACLKQLTSQQHALLSGAAMPQPTARLPNGIVIYNSPQPEVALAACMESQKQAALHMQKVSCQAPNSPHMSPQTPNSTQVDWLAAILTFAAAGLASWFACYLIIRYEHLHAHLSHDHNNAGPQKFHALPTPRIGGLGLFSGLMGGAVVVLLLHHRLNLIEDDFNYLLLAALPAFAGGLIEDITKNVGVIQRLLLTMISGAIGAWLLSGFLVRLDIPLVDIAMQWLPVAIVFTVFAVGGVANAINIIDGYNGLAAGFAVIVLSATAFVAAHVDDTLVLITSLSMMGALLGFLVWNWPKGKIFLGDGGAYLLGFMLAELSVLLVTRNPSVSPWFPLLLLAYPVFETLYTIYRRKWLNNLTPGQPDALHLHQLIYKYIVRNHPSNGCNTTHTRNNSRVAPYIWTASSLAALFAMIFWKSTTALMIAALIGCMMYVIIYKRLIKST